MQGHFAGEQLFLLLIVKQNFRFTEDNVSRIVQLSKINFMNYISNNDQFCVDDATS